MLGIKRGFLQIVLGERFMTINNKLNFNSALLFITGVAVIFLLLFVEQKIETLKNSQVNLQKIQTDILMLRRNEKDFLMRKNMKYKDKFIANYEVLQSDMQKLSEFVAANDIDSSQVNLLSENLTIYRKGFLDLIDAYGQAGLDHKSGLQGSLRKSVHNIESTINELNEPELMADMLMLRRREKDFLLRFDLKYLSKLNKDVISLERQLDITDIPLSEKQNIKQLLKAYQTDFTKMVKSYEKIGLKSDLGLRGSMRKAVHATDESLKILKNQFNKVIDAIIFKYELIVFALILIFVVVMLIINIRTSKYIAKSILNLRHTIVNIAQSSDFSIRVKHEEEDEIQDVAIAVNELMQHLKDSISSVNHVLASVANADFDERVEGDYDGDLSTLKDGVNRSANKVSFMMSELTKVMEAINDGHFDIKMDDRVPANFKEKVESSLAVIDDIIKEINQVMGGMSQGDFSQRVLISAHGDLATLKSNINKSVNTIDDSLKDVSSLIVSMSKGDLTHKINNSYSGQLQTLTNAANDSCEHLHRIVLKTIESANIVSLASGEVSKGAFDLSERVQEQAASLEETSATMEEINAAVEHNTQSASEAAKVATNVQSDSSNGTRVMKQTIDAMEEIQESSRKISDIVNLIDGIAFQTNLLALNAAVEAARAGEHGRGFAVVAGEVRNLAQKSAEAAKDITSLINESVERIDQGTKLASDSGDMLNSITDSIENVSLRINSIDKDSHRQAQSIKQVYNAVSSIDGVTQQNAALVEQTSAAAESMADQAEVLNKELSFFKLKSVV